MSTNSMFWQVALRKLVFRREQFENLALRRLPRSRLHSSKLQLSKLVSEKLDPGMRLRAKDDSLTSAAFRFTFSRFTSMNVERWIDASKKFACGRLAPDASASTSWVLLKDEIGRASCRERV